MSNGHDIHLLDDEQPDPDPAAVASLWRPVIEARRHACEAVPGGYHLMLAPDRRSACADRLAAVPRPRMADGLAGCMTNPTAGLRERRRIAETYCRTGSGWTGFGAFAAARELVETLRDRIELGSVVEASLEFWEEPFIGDLALAASRSGGAVPEMAVRLLHPAEDSYRRVFGRSNTLGEAVQVFEHRDWQLPTALIFAARGRASAALARMLPFLCPLFSRLVAVSSPDLFLDLVESEQPDAVVKILSETELAGRPARMRRDFEQWSLATLPLPDARGLALDFGSGGNAAPHLREGWSNPEARSTWAVGPASTLVLPHLPGGADRDLVLHAAPCLFPPEVEAQRLGIEANGSPIGSFRLTEPGRITACLPARLFAESRSLTLRFVHPDFATPADFGQPDDDRLLAICFERLELRPRRQA